MDLKNITMPVLNIFGEQDHLVPPSCSKPLNDLVGSNDVTTLDYPLGHIGMYVSSRSQKELAPKVAEWLIERSTPKRAKKPVAKKAKTKSKAVAKKRS